MQEGRILAEAFSKVLVKFVYALMNILSGTLVRVNTLWIVYNVLQLMLAKLLHLADDCGFARSYVESYVVDFSCRKRFISAITPNWSQKDACLLKDKTLVMG